MGTTMLLLLGAFGVFVGVLIGASSLGGVLLVPFLTYLGGIEVHAAIGAAMFSYVFAGMAGAWFFSRRGSIQWPVASWLIFGAMPGAFLGSLAKSATSGPILEFVIGSFVLFAGINALRAVPRGPVRSNVPGRPVLFFLGAATGIGSAMSGTGGPLLLLPVLLWLNVPILTAVGVAQAIQFPIASLATAGNFISGDVDVITGTVIAAALVAGIAVGAKIAHMLSQTVLRRLIASALLMVGFGILSRLAMIHL